MISHDFKQYNINTTDTNKNKNTEYEFVQHPSHYNMWSMETIDMMVKLFGIDNTITWCEMTAFKYAMRMGFKPNESVQQDVDKRNWYLNKAKQLKNIKQSSEK